MTQRVNGIDVSTYQYNINWDLLKQDPFNIKFCYMRGTIGDDSVDYRFERNYAECKRVGIDAGMYHLVWADDSVQGQIDHILEQLSTKQFDLPLALDVEVDKWNLSPQVLATHVEQLVKGLQNHIQRIILYTANWFWTPQISDTDFWETLDLWVAHYITTDPVGKTPLLPRDWATNKEWTIWQHSEKGKIAGITQNDCDLNLFNGTLQEYEDWKNGVHYPHRGGKKMLLGG